MIFYSSKFFIKKRNYFGFLCLVFLIGSCSPNDDDFLEEYPAGTNAYTNQWVYQQMQRYYYWNLKLPALIKTNLSLEPQAYYSSILYTEDRYSYSYHPSLAETFPQSLRKSYGFDMGLVTHKGQSFAAVLYSLLDSPAKKTGLLRGVLISAINGQNITTTNFKTLYETLITLDEATLTITSYSKQSGFTTPKQIHLSQSFTFNPPISGKVLHKNGKKIGYVNVPYFEVGMAGIFKEIFQTFKDQQINEVVLDLRYNGGGDVSSAVALSIILAPSINADDPFITFKGNENGGIVHQSFQEALIINESNITFETLRQAHPEINRLYVLCGTHTASASEIVINNLSPYMEVITIGESTYGKNYAGFIIQDKREPQNSGWILFPTIYSLYNADDVGDYQKGLTPTYKLSELNTLELFPLGDSQEVLFQKALELMSF